MRLRMFVFTATLVAANSALPAFADELLAPLSGSVMTLSLADRQNAYYRLTKDSSLTVTAAGPGWLSAVVRLALPVGYKDSASYRILVMDGSDTVKDFRGASVADNVEWIGLKEHPSELHKFSFPVSEKQKTFQYRLLSSDVPVAGVRFLLRRPSPHARESPLYPLAMDRMLVLIYKDRRLDFHLATTAKPVKVRVIGPTRLRAVTRLVFGPTMKGEQKYALDVQVDKDHIRQEKLSTTKAVNDVWDEESQWVPGKSQTVYVEIPKGEHNVTFTPSATDAPGVALRFTLPSQDAGNETKD